MHTKSHVSHAREVGVEQLSLGTLPLHSKMHVPWFVPTPAGHGWPCPLLARWRLPASPRSHHHCRSSLVLTSLPGAISFQQASCPPIWRVLSPPAPCLAPSFAGSSCAGSRSHPRLHRAGRSVLAASRVWRRVRGDAPQEQRPSAGRRLVPVSALVARPAMPTNGLAEHQPQAQHRLVVVP